jgi:hypothetical protein
MRRVILSRFLFFVRGRRKAPKETSARMDIMCMGRTTLKRSQTPNLNQVHWLDCRHVFAAWATSGCLNLNARLSQFTNRMVAASDDQQKDIKACVGEVRRAAGAPGGLSIGRVAGYGRCVWPSGSQLCQRQDLCVPCGFVERRRPASTRISQPR